MTHELIVIEGAGSPAEPNLMAHDLANMAVARHAGAPVVLIGDIDRGGVFASLLGSLALLGRPDRARVRGGAADLRNQRHPAHALGHRQRDGRHRRRVPSVTTLARCPISLPGGPLRILRHWCGLVQRPPRALRGSALLERHEGTTYDRCSSVP